MSRDHDSLDATRLDERRFGLILAVLLIAGIVCRIAQYAWRISYWHDEAYLVLNVRRLSFAELFGPLPNAQSAPPVFLVVQKALGNLLGQSEYAYRLLPLLLGVAGMVLMIIVARRTLNTFGAVCAVALYAFSDRLIWHASEAKQYSGDGTVALLMLLIATWPHASASKRLIVAGLAAAVLVWWSHPVIFLLGGLLLAFAPSLLRRDDGTKISPRRGWVMLFFAGLPLLISFTALYFVSIRHQERGGLYAYWSDHLADWSRPWTIPIWIAKDTFSLPAYGFEIVGPAIAIAVLAGAWTLWCERRDLLLLFIAPAMLTLLAAMIGRYPYGGTRLTVFLAPAMMLLAGAGFDGIGRMLRNTKWRRAGQALPIVLIGVGAIQAMYFLVVPRHRGHARPVVEYVLQHRTNDEPVYTLSEINSFLPYWDASTLPQPTSIERAPETADDRFWIIFAYADNDKKRRSVMAEMDAGETYRQIDAFNTRGAAAFRFEREAPAATSPTSLATPP